MSSTRDIQKRIRSVKNIAQITKAMEVVSMNKMRRSQLFALAARPYALAALGMLKNLLDMTPEKMLPAMLTPKKITHPVLVVITADKGLVGGFNDNVLREAEKWAHEKDQEGLHYSIVTVGKKARDHFERKHISPEKVFTDYGDYTEFSDTRPIAEYILEGFEKNKWDGVYIAYTHFKTTLKQETLLRQLLPASKVSLEDIIQEIIPEYGLYSNLRKIPESHSKYNFKYKFEPSVERILSYLISSILKIAFHHVMLESNASEHSARMVTMKNASDNATDLKGRLTLQMNKARQSAITAEISEIIAGAEALQ
jgi:F-type H+-transporting ATPase subunit gamma